MLSRQSLLVTLTVDGNVLNYEKPQRSDQNGMYPQGQTKGKIIHTVLVSKLRDSVLDSLHTSRSSHLLGRVVGCKKIRMSVKLQHTNKKKSLTVATSTVPVTLLEDLGVESDLDSPLLGNSV